MDDMTAFERQLAGELVHDAGPVRAVDAAAIFARSITAATTPQRRGRPLFSAVRLVAAAVAVALLGGLLAVTGSPAPTTTDDLLSRLITEEVEPGVRQVVNDGVRDLSRIPHRSSTLSEDTTFDSAIAAGSDGSIWMSMPEGSFRVGQARTWDGDAAVLQTTVAVGADGAIYTSWTHAGVRRLLDDEWVALEDFAGEWVSGLDFTSDGTLWARVEPTETATARIIHLGEDGLTVQDVPKQFALNGFGVNPGHFFGVSDDGHVWARSLVEPPRGLILSSFDGEAWKAIDTTGAALRAGPFDIGADGTLWAYFTGQEESEGVLGRLRDGRWAMYAAADGVPPMVDMYQGFEGFLRAADDGSVWLTPQPTQAWDGSRFRQCDGVARFDGVAWQHYLRGYCVYAFDVAPDGAAWLHAEPEPDPGLEADGASIDTYVIVPEAAAADR